MACSNASLGMSDMLGSVGISALKYCGLGRPALRLADDEVAEHLHTGHRLQLFGIDKISVELNRVRLAEELNQTIVFFDQVVRQCCNAQALLAGAHQAQNIVDLEVGFARAGAVAPGIDQPVAVLQVRRTPAASLSMMMRCPSSSSSVRGVPKRLIYSGEQ